ncbi:MAG: hypothetical protein GYA62_14600 [Bacteroidales bacterium]|nr:hypothetical protein [Bacteroidales bacterium]
MKRFEIQTTEDGSLTIYDTLFNETFHSKYGARSESEYVFIEQGLKKFLDVSEINILEIGFGTGMNTLLTLLNKPIEQKIYYEAIELFPLQQELVELYCLLFSLRIFSNAFKEGEALIAEVLFALIFVGND